MSFRSQFKQELFRINENNFEAAALALFRFQAVENTVYRDYLNCLNINPNKINLVHQIPFLPIEFFKTHSVRSENDAVQTIFESSGTTGQLSSKHYVSDTAFYEGISETIFQQFYGHLSDYHILALLPSYLERGNSSLVYMVSHFMKKASPESGFYLSDFEDLAQKIQKLRSSSQKILLLGVTFALLDFAEAFPMDLSGAILMETGGMKGRRRELLREEAHSIWREAFGKVEIHSEYGMTELMSQGYAVSDAWFRLPPWCRLILRELNDPFAYNNRLSNGGINLIDLANVDSCAFLETKDIGVFNREASAFRVLGRFDSSDLRGCNLMVV
jgi:phenylacetate-coenzyme A ligase PaaK-like adenylate-forming protein